MVAIRIDAPRLATLSTCQLVANRHFLDLLICATTWASDNAHVCQAQQWGGNIVGEHVVSDQGKFDQGLPPTDPASFLSLASLYCPIIGEPSDRGKTKGL